jgi:multidrug efflux pump
MARFFIDRPIFAWVLAIITMLAGAVAILNLPIAQYPSIAPPAISIAASYPGASAQTLEDTVTQVIEQKLKGMDNLAYLAATSESSGQVTITATFDTGTDPDIAQVQVQNKLASATPLLPQQVQQLGLRVTKSTSNFVSVLAFVSEDARFTAADLTDYVVSNVEDVIARVPGIGDTLMFGAEYAMRIWLDPTKLASYNLTAVDVERAIRAQNAQIAAGQIGGLPAVGGQALNATITAQTRLKTSEEFAAILLRTLSDGSQVRLSDVARVELGSEGYDTLSFYDGKPAAGLGLKLGTGANALETMRLVDARLAELQPFFPSGVKVVKPFETTPFVKISIEEVVKTLIEAVVLVFLVMFLFLQNFRATLIPTIAVPVVLLGTFGVLAVFGYSINTLTMLAMVLAIGLLVDDAIVVVENVERLMTEEGLSPVEATRKSMGQITGALVGVALVLSAVFVPMAFFGGSTGVIYRQFSITIVAAMTLSVLVAIVFTPALCATILKPIAQGHGRATRGFFGWFNRGFDRTTRGYHGLVGGMLRRGGRWMLVYGVLAALVGYGFTRLPGGFLPDEDQGSLYTLVQLPPGATQERTLEVVRDVEHHFLKDQAGAVDSVMSIAGFSFAGTGQNAALMFVKLKPWDERKATDLKVPAVLDKAMRYAATLRDAQVFAFGPPAVSELGNATGFDLMLQDRGNLGHAALMQARNQLLGALSKEPGLVGVRPNGLEDNPEFRLMVDAQRVGALGLSLADVNSNFSAAWGSSYVDDFIDRGRVKKVFMQADPQFRMLPSDVDRWYVRSEADTMVPFTSFAETDWASGSPRLERYNGVPSVEIQGMGLPGKLSSSQALDLVEKHVAELPPGIGFEWTGLSRQERQASGQAVLLYAASILIVFLCLAALYESWSIPVSVLLVIPLGVLGTVVGALIAFKLNDVYFQVGLLTTVGLSSKNAILIVEFAKDLEREGKSLFDAALEAAQLRLRPILMTSLAFVLGTLPLLLNGGAGSGAQNAIGTAVIGGMLSGTLLAIVFVPVFFLVVRRLFNRKPHAQAAAVVAPLPQLEGSH